MKRLTIYSPFERNGDRVTQGVVVAIEDDPDTQIVPKADDPSISFHDVFDDEVEVGDGYFEISVKRDPEFDMPAIKAALGAQIMAAYNDILDGRIGKPEGFLPVEYEQKTIATAMFNNPATSDEDKARLIGLFERTATPKQIAILNGLGIAEIGAGIPVLVKEAIFNSWELLFTAGQIRSIGFDAIAAATTPLECLAVMNTLKQQAAAATAAFDAAEPGQGGGE